MFVFNLNLEKLEHLERGKQGLLWANNILEADKSRGYFELF